MVGFCSDDVKLSGPVQANVASSEFVVAVNCNVSPTHGVLDEAFAVTVLPMVCTLSVAEDEQPLLSMTVTVYSPAVSEVNVLSDCGSPLLRV